MLVGNVMAVGYFETLDVDGKIILNWIFS